MEADWELKKQGDLEGLSALRRDDVVLWWGDKPMPIDKKIALINYRGWFNYDKPINCELEPLAIQIIGDVANIFYTYKFSGKILSGSGRQIETWIKQDNKWLLISSFEARCDKLPPCK